MADEGVGFNDLSDFDKGWVVGIIEGEGNIGRYSKRDRISIEMADEDCVKRFHKLTDNTTCAIYSRKRVTEGRQHHKKIYRSFVSGPKARLLMIDIFPYMSERKQLQIQNVLLGGLS